MDPAGSASNEICSAALHMVMYTVTCAQCVAAPNGCSGTALERRAMRPAVERLHSHVCRVCSRSVFECSSCRPVPRALHPRMCRITSAPRNPS